MLVLLVGLVVISVPVILALRTALRLTRTIGAVDAHEIANAIRRTPDFDLRALGERLDRQAAGSIAQRLVAVVLGDEPLPARKLALAEEVAEIERSIEGDMRVPRVAASLATTGGLFAAALAMREGLGVALPEGADPLPYYFGVIDKGLTLAAIAVLGGIVCASLHRQAQKERRARIAELDALIAALGKLVFGEEPE